MRRKQQIQEGPSYQDTKRSLGRGILICSLATIFLLYEFILQVSPSIMTKNLMVDLGLTFAGLGTTMGFYYYGYTIMQIPGGLLFDRFGPRRLLTLATLTCALGALAFASATGSLLAATSRFFMGIGSAFAFTGALLLIANWFPPHYFALLTGIVQLSSCIGAIGGQRPLVPIIQMFGWRNTINTLGLLGVGLAALIWLIVRDKPYTKSQTTANRPIAFKAELTRLKHVFKNKQTWWVGLYSFAVWAPMLAFTALWGIPFLEKAYFLTTQQASYSCAIIWLAVGIGSPLLGLWSDTIQKRRLPLTVSALLGAFSLSALIYWPLSPLAFYMALLITGLSATGQALAFSLVKENNSSAVVGTAMGFNNMAVVAGGALFQPLLGILLGQASNLNEQFISVQTYQQAFVVLPICNLIAAIISHYCIRETYCQSLPDTTSVD